MRFENFTKVDWRTGQKVMVSIDGQKRIGTVIRRLLGSNHDLVQLILDDDSECCVSFRDIFYIIQ